MAVSGSVSISINAALLTSPCAVMLSEHKHLDVEYSLMLGSHTHYLITKLSAMSQSTACRTSALTIRWIQIDEMLSKYTAKTKYGLKGLAFTTEFPY